jgi:hypothetical protein
MKIQDFLVYRGFYYKEIFYNGGISIRAECQRKWDFSIRRIIVQAIGL